MYGITAEKDFGCRRLFKSLSSIVLFTFFISQTGIAYAADAPALEFNPQSGMPEAIVTADVIRDAEARRLIEQEEEKKKKEESEEFFGTEEGPLSEPTQEGDTLEESGPAEDDANIDEIASFASTLQGFVNKKSSARKSNQQNRESKPVASQAAFSAEAGSAAKVEAREQENASVRESYLFPPIFVQQPEREEKHKMIEAIKDLLEDQKRERDRERDEKNDQVARAKLTSREVIKEFLGPIVVMVRRYFDSDNAPTVQELTPAVLSAPSDRRGETLGLPEVSGSAPNFAIGDANVAAEYMQKKPLMLTNPEAYASGAATLKIALISLVTSMASATNNADIIEFVNAQYINSLEQTNENDVVNILTQIMDLEKAIEQLVEEQQDMANGVAEEAEVVRNVLKALAPHQNDISESVIKEILAKSKPANIQFDDYLQGKSLSLYLENQLLQWQEVKVQAQKDIEMVKATGARPDADLDELKNALKETTAMLITAEMWQSLAATAREKLEQYFNELLNARESLRDALEKFGQMKETAFENAVDRIQASEKHMYHIWARTEELYEQISELSTLRQEYVEKLTQEILHIGETARTLQGIRTDNLTAQQKAAVESLRERVEKIQASNPSLEPFAPVNLDFELAQSTLKEASSIELAAAAAVATGIVDAIEMQRMEQSMEVLSEQILALAGKMIEESNRAKSDIQLVESALNGAKQRVLLIDGYLEEIRTMMSENPLIPQ